MDFGQWRPPKAIISKQMGEARETDGQLVSGGDGGNGQRTRNRNTGPASFPSCPFREATNFVRCSWGKSAVYVQISFEFDMSLFSLSLSLSFSLFLPLSIFYIWGMYRSQGHI